MMSRLPALLLLAAVPTAAAAQEAAPDTRQLSGVAYGGLSVGNGWSGYAGLVSALSGARLGKGPAFRAGANAGKFHYVDATGERTGRYLGGELAGVMQASGSWGWFNASLGGRFNRLDLDRADPANDRAGPRFDLGAQVDGAVDRGPLRLVFIGSRGLFRKDYYARINPNVLADPARQLRVGAELGVQGDPLYRSTRVGGTLSVQPVKAIEMGLSAGIASQRGRKDSAYAGISVSTLLRR